MKRNYSSGEHSGIEFFIGNEVERTPAYGMKTLFITGVHNVEDIEEILAERKAYTDESMHIKHIFFGANHSFNPKSYEEWNLWEAMITHFLKKEYLCSLDIPLAAVAEFNDGGLNEFNNFIPQIRIPIPYIKLWNYNTMLKIDDKGFNETNPGIWTHRMHTLMDPAAFTSWSEYNNDVIIK